jgi:hypothetical protein
MSNTLHFGKIRGICWVICMVAYIFVVFTWGFGVSVAWRGSHPPIWAVQTMFWLWPVVPAFLIAGLWEVLP